MDEAGKIMYGFYKKWDLTIKGIMELGWDQEIMDELQRLLDVYCLVASGSNERNYESGRYRLDGEGFRNGGVLGTS
ncbi:hypothetical protein TWF506_005933 [Arthrobotrys conoides]|uniref:Uncharacterized protein n=1 Tax=Arthrobotrys conoides TaxID=74498 RepID=A0AAN8PQ97_9PEZI